MIKDIEKILGSQVEDINIDFLNNRVSFTLKKRIYKDNYLEELFLYELVFEEVDKIDYEGVNIKWKIRTYVELEGMTVEKGDYIELLNKLKESNEISYRMTKVEYKEKNKDYYEVILKISESSFEFRSKNIFINLLRKIDS